MFGAWRGIFLKSVSGAVFDAEKGRSHITALFESANARLATIKRNQLATIIFSFKNVLGFLFFFFFVSCVAYTKKNKNPEKSIESTV